MANCGINKLWRKLVSHSSSGFSPAQQTRSSTLFGNMKIFKMREQVFSACCPDFLFSLLTIGKKDWWQWWQRLHFLYSFNSCCCNLGSFIEEEIKTKEILLKQGAPFLLICFPEVPENCMQYTTVFLLLTLHFMVSTLLTNIALLVIDKFAIK